MEAVLKPHKPYLFASRGDKTLYVMLKIVPDPEEAQLTDLALSLVVDTSGSMQQDSGDGTIKIQKVIDVLASLPELKVISDRDIFNLIKFDTNASLLWNDNIKNVQKFLNEINNLKDYSGSTYMAKGLRQSIDILSELDKNYLKKIFVFTDGQTFDEDIIKKEIISNLLRYRFPIIAIGVGSDYNEELLSEITDQCTGVYYHLTRISEFKEIFFREIINAKRESIRDVFIKIYKPSDIYLSEVVRIYPSFYKVKKFNDKYFLGNLLFTQESVFLFQLTVPPRSEGHYLCMSVELEYNLIGKFPYKEELALYINFTKDEHLSHRVDPEVATYVYQRNVQSILDEASNICKKDPKQAESLLKKAENLTKQLGNVRVTKTIRTAIENLKTKGYINSNITKALMSDGRTKTVSYSGSKRSLINRNHKSLVNPSGLTEEEIRRYTGV